MFTSRAEFRLHLRIDNADHRLTPHGRRVGLINDAAWSDFLAKQKRLKAMRELLECTRVNADVPELLEKFGDGTAGSTLAQLLKRPEVQIEELAAVISSQLSVVSKNSPGDPGPPATGNWQLTTAFRNELKSVETEIKYAGYLDQQTKAIERLKKAEQRVIPDWFDYAKVSGLSREMREKMTQVRPRTLGQASRIPGVTPAAVSLINVFIEIQARQHAGAPATN